jgi:hypothetical protein
MQITTGYGSWNNHGDRDNVTIEASIADAVNGAPRDWHERMEESGAFDRIAADYRSAIDDALPEGIALSGNEFIGMHHTDPGYTDAVGDFDIAAAIKAINLQAIIERHDVDATPLDEMGTDDLLRVLRAHVGELPEGSAFAAAWKRLDETLTNGGVECLPAPWDGYGDHAPEGADFDTAASLNARFLPQNPHDENTRPCVEIGTVQVYTYRKDGALRVSVDTSGVDVEGPEARKDADRTVPMEISVNGKTVFGTWEW